MFPDRKHLPATHRPPARPRRPAGPRAGPRPAPRFTHRHQPAAPRSREPKRRGQRDQRGRDPGQRQHDPPDRTAHQDDHRPGHRKHARQDCRGHDHQDGATPGTSQVDTTATRTRAETEPETAQAHAAELLPATRRHQRGPRQRPRRSRRPSPTRTRTDPLRLPWKPRPGKRPPGASQAESARIADSPLPGRPRKCPLRPLEDPRPYPSTPQVAGLVLDTLAAARTVDPAENTPETDNASLALVDISATLLVDQETNREAASKPAREDPAPGDQPPAPGDPRKQTADEGSARARTRDTDGDRPWHAHSPRQRGRCPRPVLSSPVPSVSFRVSNGGQAAVPDTPRAMNPLANPLPAGAPVPTR